jgi:hypothetical protein
MMTEPGSGVASDVEPPLVGPQMPPVVVEPAETQLVIVGATLCTVTVICSLSESAGNPLSVTTTVNR